MVIGWSAAVGMGLVALSMVLTPGPNMMYLVSRSVSQGVGAGLISLLGTVVGFVVYMTLANLGLTTVFLLVPWLFVIVKLAGAAYLLYLAWQAIRPRGRSLFETSTLRPDSAAKLFRMGLVTNLLNPKAAIMYLALIPQFIEPGAGQVVLQGFVLGGIQIGVSAVVNSGFILGAGLLAAFLRTRPTWARVQRLVTGTLLGMVAVKVATESPARA